MLDTAPAREVIKITKVWIQPAGVGEGPKLFGRRARGLHLALEAFARINFAALPLLRCLVRISATEAAEEKVTYIPLRHRAVEIA